MLCENIYLNILLWVIIAAAAAIVLYLALILLGFIYLFTVCLTCSRTKNYTKFSKYYYHVYIFGTRLLCFAAKVRVHITGKEKIPADKRFVLISNHRSNWDNIVQAKALPKYPMAFISKPENFKIPFVGRLVKRCLFLSINRGNLRDGLQTILTAAEMVKNDVISIGVYPEGTRSRDYKLHDFKPGCLKVAEKSKCPLVIMAVRGTENIHKNVPFRHTDVYLDVLDVLGSEQTSEKKTVELAEIAQSEVGKFLQENDSY